MATGDPGRGRGRASRVRNPQHCGQAGPVGLGLQPRRGPRRPGRRTALLLAHVGQLVGQQRLAGHRAGAVRAPGEVDVGALGKGQRPRPQGAVGGQGVGVQGDPGQVAAHDPLHALPHGGQEGATGAACRFAGAARLSDRAHDHRPIAPWSGPAVVPTSPPAAAPGDSVLGTEVVPQRRHPCQG